MSMKKRLRSLTGTPPVWARALGPRDVVMATRVGIPRNLSGRSFPHRMRNHQLTETLDEVSPFFTKRGLQEFRVSEMDGYDVSLLWERGLSLGNDPEHGTAGKAVFMDEHEKKIVMVNELDHFWIVTARSGLQLRRCLDEAIEIEDSLAAEYSLAKNDKDGYLTSWIEMHGTGVRLSVIIFIPAIMVGARGEFLEYVDTLKDVGVAGPFGISPLEDNPPLGGAMLQMALMTSDEHGTAEGIAFLEGAARNISAMEIEHRRNMSQSALDLLGRMWGGVKERVVADEMETAAGIQMGLLGAWNGIVEDWEIPLIQKMVYLVLDGHMMSAFATRSVAPELVRANFVKSILTGRT